MPSSSGAERIVRIVYEIDGVDEASASQQTLGDALRETGEALGEQSNAVERVQGSMRILDDLASRSEQVTQRLHQSMQALAGGLGQVSAAMGTETEGGRVLGQMSRFAATGIQLGSAFGPIGGVLGGVTGAVLGLGEALVPVVPAIRDVTDEAQRSADAAAAMGDAFAGAGDRMRAFVDSVSTAARARGLADLDAQITEISDRIASLSTGGSALDRLELPGLRDRLAGLVAESDATRAGLDEEGREVGRGRRGGRGGPRQRSPSERFRSDDGAALRGLIADADAGGADAIGFARGLGSDRAENEREKLAERDDAEKRALQENERLREMQHRAQLQRIEEQVEAWTSAGERIGGVISSAFTSAIQGQEDFGVAVVKGFKSIAIEFGGQMIAEGVGALFTAIGSTVLNPPAAATKAAEGAGKIALGVGLGAAGAAIPVPSSGGGAQAKPPRLGPSANDAPGGGSVVVNMNAPAVVTGTQWEVGREIGRALRGSERRFGRAA